MTPDELKKLAARVVEWMLTPNVDDACHNMPSDVFYAAYHVAKAYLAAHPADDAEPLTEEWLVSLLPSTKSSGRGAGYIGECGRIDWNGRGDTFVAWLNGAVLDISRFTRGDLRRLLAAIKVPQSTPSTSESH